MQGRDVRALLSAGAAGVVLAHEVPLALAPCLCAVQVGQVCVPRGHFREVDPPALSAREKQILALVVMGYSNIQIAEQLYVAESTVKSHLSSAFGKLGVRSRNEAVHSSSTQTAGLGWGYSPSGANASTLCPYERASKSAPAQTDVSSRSGGDLLSKWIWLGCTA